MNFADTSQRIPGDSCKEFYGLRKGFFANKTSQSFLAKFSWQSFANIEFYDILYFIIYTIK